MKKMLTPLVLEALRQFRNLSEGGEGSGHFGHAGRPGEVGGSGEGDGDGGKEVNSGITVYHSTAEAYASSIMEKGLLVGKAGKGMVKGVYASTEPGEAFAYGTQAAVKEFQNGMKSGKYTEKDIPNLKVILIVADKSKFPMKIYGKISMSQKNVPSSSFKRVEIYRYKDAETFKSKWMDADSAGKPLPTMPPPNPIKTITETIQRNSKNEVFLCFVVKEA